MEGYEGNGRPQKDFRHAPFNALVDNWKSLDLTDADFRVMSTIWRKANFKTNRLKGITLEQLADDMGKSLSRLKQSISKLEKIGFIRRRRGGKHRATEYLVCKPELLEESPSEYESPSYPDCLL